VAAVSSGGTSGYSNEASATPTSALPNGYSYFATYDPVGNVASYNDSVMGSWTFGYDPLNRLVSAENTAVTGTSAQFLDDYGCWKYDDFGNREYESMSTTACTNNPPLLSWASYTTTNTNRMDATNFNPNQATNGYDGAGNVIYDGNYHYLYDPEGRVCAVWNSTAGVATGYIYDAEGVRVAKGTVTIWGSCDPSINGVASHLTNVYALGLGNEQFTETDGNGNWQHTNVWAAGKLLATYSTSLYFYMDDPLGSRRVEANYAGVTQGDCTSGPYGDFEGCPPTPTEHLFTGKERDTESGNDYFGARYYASALGRFMSPDPSGLLAQRPDDPQSWNLYAYVRNNPLVLIDPSGLDCVNPTNNTGGFTVNHDTNSGACGKSGGTWVPGYVDESWVKYNDNNNQYQVASINDTGSNEDSPGSGSSIDYATFKTGAVTDESGDCLSGCKGYGFSTQSTESLESQLVGKSDLGNYLHFLSDRTQPLTGGLLSKIAYGGLAFWRDHWAGPGGFGPPGGRGDWAASVHDFNFDQNGPIKIGMYFNPAISPATAKALIQSDNMLIRNAGGGLQAGKFAVFFGAVNAFQFYVQSWK